MSQYYRNNPDEPIRHDWLSTTPALSQPVTSFENRESCSSCGEWAVSGGPLCEDCEEDSNYD